MELKAMGISIDIDRHVFLRDIRDNARTEGMVTILRELLETKFGPLPRWAQEKLAKTTPAQAERWAKRF
jgi:hypothetical protein